MNVVNGTVQDEVKRQWLDETLSLAREGIYRFLGLALRGPHEAIWPSAVELADAPLLAAAGKLCAEAVGASSDLGATLAQLAEQIRGQSRERMQEEYDRIFGLVLPKECPPCETEYLRAADVFQRSQVMADVAGFYRAFGLKPSRRAPERPDHLTLMYEFMATVLMKQRLADDAEKREICCRAAAKFFEEHLLWWVPAFSRGLERKAGAGFYADLARAIREWTELEKQLYGCEEPERAARAKPELIERPEEAPGCLECPLFRGDSGE